MHDALYRIFLTEWVLGDSLRDIGGGGRGQVPQLFSHSQGTMDTINEQGHQASLTGTIKRVLVIDDDSVIRLFIRSCLEEFGYSVLEAENGDAGIELFGQNPADLVIVDLYMPEKEGIETIIELRRGNPHLKILAISGGIPRHGPDNLLNAAQILGADSCLTKPFTVQQLLNAVEKQLAS